MNLTSTDENRGSPCQTTGFGYFRSIQRKLDKAVANDDKTLDVNIQGRRGLEVRQPKTSPRRMLSFTSLSIFTFIISSSF